MEQDEVSQKQTSHTVNTRCPQRCCCGSSYQRESIHAPDDERWLGTCQECASMICISLREPGRLVRDPLTFFLTGCEDPARPEGRPAYLRFIHVSSGPPWGVKWNLEQSACGHCGGGIAVQSTRLLSPTCRADYEICVGCGRSRAAYTNPYSGGLLGEVVGQTWSPPDPCATKIRRDIFQSFRLWRDGRRT